jgi:hypothetical protein
MNNVGRRGCDGLFHSRCALKERSAFDFHARRLNVAVQSSTRAKNAQATGVDIAHHRALDFNLSRDNVPFDRTAGTHNDGSIGPEFAAKFAVDAKVAFEIERALKDCASFDKGARNGGCLFRDHRRRFGLKVGLFSAARDPKPRPAFRRVLHVAYPLFARTGCVETACS